MLKIPDLVVLWLKEKCWRIFKDWLGDSWSFKDFTKKHGSLSSSNVDVDRRLSWSCSQRCSIAIFCCMTLNVFSWVDVFFKEWSPNLGSIGKLRSYQGDVKFFSGW